jgi:hypothetical protein
MQKVGVWMLVAALAGCAAPGPRTTTVSHAKLQSLLAARFPYTSRVGPLFELQAQAPQLRLLPTQNRLGTAIQVQVTERLTRTVFTGVLDMDYSVQFEPGDQTLRMADVHVNSLSFTGVPERYQAVVQGLGPLLAERVLDGVKLHQISAKDMALVDGWGYTPGSIDVTDAGLRITLQPKKLP